MRPHYDNPPLVEAIFEFFAEDAKIQDTATLLPLFQAEFPECSEPPSYVEMSSFELQLNPNEPVIINKEQVQPRCRIKTPENNTRNYLIQFAYNMCALNVFKPYLHYEPEYLPLIKKLFDFYIYHAQPQSFKLTGQRYINYITLPPHSSPQEFFTFYPEFAPQFQEQTRPRFSMQIEYQHLSKGSLMLSLNQDLTTSTDELSFFLDIYARCDEPIEANWEALSQWHHEAHQAIQNGFEQSITNQSRQLFGMLHH